MSTISLCPLALALLLLPPAAWSQRFTVTPIPVVSESVAPYAVGNGGHVVGSFFGGAGSQAFRSVPGGAGLTPMLQPPGNGGAFAVNTAGVAVGYVTDPYIGVGAHWAPDGTLTPLPEFYTAEGINDSGEIAGNTPFPFNAARRSADGGLTILPGLGGSESSARGINAAGTVVGTSWGAEGGRATIWRKGQDPLDLGSLPSPFGYDYESFGVAINARDWVVGSSGEGFVWDPVRGMRSLGDMSPRGVNDAGQVVGLPGLLIGAALWNERTGQHDLGALVGNPAVTGAAGINRHAQIALETSTEAGGTSAALLTLHPDWTGGNGAWHDGEHWDWAGTGTAGAVLGRMHQARIVASENTRVRLDADAEVMSLQLGATDGSAATLVLEGTRLDLATELRIGGGGVLAGRGTLAAGEAIVFEPGATIDLVAGDVLHLSGPVALDHGVLRLQLGSRLVFDGDVDLTWPTFEIVLGQGVPQPGTFDLIEWNGLVTLADGSGFTLLLPSLPDGLFWTNDLILTQGGSVTIQAVPEPPPALLLAIGLAAFALRRLAARRESPLVKSEV
jgi:probable HAF family extracellular repeat protein